jgi:dTDP-4-dehydrorhamnose reductase
MVTKVVVLGASGMLGHKMTQILSRRFDVIGTVRRVPTSNILEGYKLIAGDVNDLSTLFKTFDLIKPDIIVNCIGIVKQLPESNDWDKSCAINSEFPHKLSTYARSHNVRMFIHISTDCVFDGKNGMYKETDIPNATDIYGRTKYMGEIPECLTLRTSIIGREILTKHGLLEWFLSNKGGHVKGYTKSIFSGVTTNELAHLVDKLIYNEYCKDLTGLYHVASNPINKFELLKIINSYLEKEDKVDIEQVDGEIIDRTLDGSKLKKDFGYIAPDWDTMIAEVMRRDKTKYSHKECL